MSKIISKLLHSIYGTNLKDENYEFISEFTILWSIFESRLKKNDKSLNYERIANVINSSELKNIRENVKLIENIPKYIFIETLPEDIILAFPNIDFKVKIFPTKRETEYAWFKKQFENLELIKKQDSKIILLMCFVCYRLRNNLFHGNKKFEELQAQKDLFNLVNNFLCEILVKMKNIELN